MNVRYTILFRVRVRHEYYTSGFSKDFEIIPTPSCQEILNQFGFLFRNLEDGFLLLARVESANPSVLFQKIGTQNLRFAFEMKLKSPYFYNISGRENIPNNPNTIALNEHKLGKEIFLFNNKTNTSTANSTYLGNPKENLRVGTPIDLVTGFTYNFSFGQALQNTAITMEDAFGSPKTPIPQLALQNGETTQSFQINLKEVNRLHPGLYVVKWVTGESKFMYEPKLQLNRTFGIIEIFKNDNTLIVPTTHRFLNADTIETKEFFIDFKAHPPVRWYYVLNKKAGNSIPLAINSTAILGFSPKPAGDLTPITGERILRSNTIKNVREVIPALTMTASDDDNQANYSFQLPQPSMHSNIIRVNGPPSFYYYELYYYV